MSKNVSLFYTGNKDATTHTVKLKGGPFSTRIVPKFYTGSSFVFKSNRFIGYYDENGNWIGNSFFIIHSRRNPTFGIHK